VHKASAYTFFVANNGSDKKLNRQERLTSKVANPHRLLGHQTLHYLWTMDDTDESSKKCAEMMSNEARNLVALGWGIDQVAGNGQILSEAESTALQGHRWRALETHPPGLRTYRVPVAGSLEALEKAYRSLLDSVDGEHYHPRQRLTEYTDTAYIRETKLPFRPYAVFELPDAVALPQEDSVRVAAMLRSLTCIHARKDTHRFPCEKELYVAGHVREDDRGQPRFSYIPLPTIGQAYEDGMIRRLMIAEPFGGDGRHAKWAQQRLRGEALQPCDPKSNALLKDQNGNDRGFLKDLWRSTSGKMVSLYTAESRAWCSVTPVILPGYDDMRTVADDSHPTKAERLLFKSLLHAGIPFDLVESVIFRKAPFWPCSQHPKSYYRPDYLKNYHARPGWHVRLVFREPLAGPLTIGAGRHCGLGIMAGSED
jgi:CRISPR-associated protein Csb2